MSYALCHTPRKASCEFRVPDWPRCSICLMRRTAARASTALTDELHVQGEAADLAVYLGQPQGSDPSWLLETLAGFVLSYDQALQVLLSKVQTRHSVQHLHACTMPHTALQWC